MQHCSSTKVSKHSAVRRQRSDVQMKEAIGSVLNDGLSHVMASSSSGPQQLVHIPLSPRLSSNLPSRNSSPLSNLLNLPVQSEIPWKTGKVRFLTSAECVQALKDKERKKQKEAVRKALHFEERSQKKNQREEELCRKKEEMARKTAEGEAAMVEKEVAKTKRETAKLQVREKRKL